MEEIKQNMIILITFIDIFRGPPACMQGASTSILKIKVKAVLKTLSKFAVVKTLSKIAVRNIVKISIHKNIVKICNKSQNLQEICCQNQTFQSQRSLEFTHFKHCVLKNIKSDYSDKNSRINTMVFSLCREGKSLCCLFLVFCTRRVECTSCEQWGLVGGTGLWRGLGYGGRMYKLHCTCLLFIGSGRGLLLWVIGLSMYFLMKYTTRQHNTALSRLVMSRHIWMQITNNSSVAPLIKVYMFTQMSTVLQRTVKPKDAAKLFLMLMMPSFMMMVMQRDPVMN